MKDEYPKDMRHPNFAKAVLSDDTKAGPNGGRFREAPRGLPDRFPPVSVNNADQEEYYASRGYVVGRQHMPIVNQHTHKERENIRMREVPQANDPPPTGEYPKWVGDKIAKNAEEEAEILRIMKEFEGRLPTVIPPLPLSSTEEKIDSDELAAFRAWKANRERVESMARGSEKNEPVKKRRAWTPEQRQRMKENLAKARAARRERESDHAEGI